jgi:hypothetical protein
MPPAKKAAKPAAKKAPATVAPKTVKKTVTPTPVELRISYSIGTKVNIGNFESVDFHLSESESYDVTGMTVSEVEAFWNEREEALHERLGDTLLKHKSEQLED